MLREEGTGPAASPDRAEGLPHAGQPDAAGQAPVVGDGIPDAALALWLVQQAAQRGALLYVPRSGGRGARVADAARAFAPPGLEVLELPPWDVLPYDRAAPSAGVVGRRVAALRLLAREPDGSQSSARLVVAAAESLLQRVQPAAAWQEDPLLLRPGDVLDTAAFTAALAALGYRHLDERVDEPGEAALRGQVLDVFPAADDRPVRATIEDGRVTALVRFDPATQRSEEAVDRAVLDAAVEFPPDADEIEAAAEAIADPDAAAASGPQDADDPDGGGTETADPPPPRTEPPPRLVPLFHLLGGMAAVVDADAPQRWTDAREAAEDAYAIASRTRRAVGATGAGRADVLPRPGRMYLPAAQLEAGLAGRERIAPGVGAPEAPQALGAAPATRMAGLVRQLRAGGGVVVAAADPARVARALRRAGLELEEAASWDEARQAAQAGCAAVFRLDLAEGFELDGLRVLPAPTLSQRAASVGVLQAVEAPRTGDLVVHLDHGVARLRGLTAVGEGTEQEERAALEYADGADLLVPVGELNQVWRYGAGADGDRKASLDRLAGDAWRRKREEIEAELANAARQLAAQAAERAARHAPVIEPPAEAARLARRFPYQPSPDQAAAVRAVLADMAQPRPMDRLVCGDVGFGKTEVALRAAAAAALAGWQVAVVAPTTVLARQHLETFRRRFAGTKVAVEGLFGTLSGPDGKAVRAAVAKGEVGVLVGTQAVAGKEVRFARLGLVVVDEEQRFGEALKARLAALRAGEEWPHLLTMTATPIPRTMQAALAGLRECSVIATAPVRRQPTRTFVLPWDPAVAREALLRERARGGQSFLVCPRIEDLGRWAARLRETAPELEVVQAHGRMKPAALEGAVVGFAEGRGDVLLATNIIEAGLDIPQANTILVADADRFGLAQLHQLRGRVGRGARRGSAYLMTEPGRRIARATQRRLRTLEAAEGLGAGAQVALADLELRGAGDLFGERQAGHVRAFGTELFQHLLAQAVAANRGEPPQPPPPELRVELTGRIPDDWVPEADLRLSLYHRLARLRAADEIAAFAEELADRFGPLPAPAQALLELTRLRALGADAGLERLDAGPHAVALTPHDPMRLPELAARMGGTVKGERLVLPLAIADPAQRAERVAALLEG